MKQYKPLFAFGYKNILKPILFKLDTEFIHDSFTNIGALIGTNELLYSLTNKIFAPKPKLEESVIIDGITLKNKVGLAAGFDYAGKMARTMKAVGFGYTTVGTVTAQYYEGNTKPRLGRLPKSKALLVNKGFKSPGALEVKKILDKQKLDGHVVGISVGSSNIPEVDTIEKAIEDYLFTLNVFKDLSYVSYFEINISCPNARISEQFAQPETLEKLLSAIAKLNIKKPLWLKMANEISVESAIMQVKTALKYGIKTVILSNLVKDRTNKYLNPEELAKIAHLKGNFSGKPAEANANNLIKTIKDEFKDNVDIIGLGGIFSSEDAQAKLDAGATAVQLITGMIYEGPQLISDIVMNLSCPNNGQDSN